MLVWIWIGFLAFVLLMVALDLGVFHRRPHEVSIREALAWTSVWIVLALAFNVLVYFMYEHDWFGWTSVHSHDLTGRQAAVQFFTGYVIEKSLSVDNIFVIALIFAHFRVPAREQHRLLVWGVLGALVLRGVMIALGAVLIDTFSWITYVFGFLLLATAVKLLVVSQETIHPERNLLFRLARRIYPVSPTYDGSRFFTRMNGRLAVTPLFLALVLVESSDVMFAVDSIPAIFAITRDPFLVYTSNVFAILGLRALFFVLAGLVEQFRYLKTSLVFILAYVGVKMALSNHMHISNVLSLAVILGILLVGIAASIIAPRPAAEQG